MIVEALVSMMTGLVGLIFGLFGSLPAPDWITGLGGQLESLVSMGSSMGAWVPWGVIGGVVGALVACAALSLVVRLVRMGLSLFTGGGGA